MILRFVIFLVVFPLPFFFLFFFAFVGVLVVVLLRQVSFAAATLLDVQSIRGLDAVPPPFSLTQKSRIPIASAGIPL